MIVSASYRTDIPAFYPGWLMTRLREGRCQVRNPYGGGVATVDLTPGALDGMVLWTKNIGPLLPDLAEIAERTHGFYVQYTVNAYPAALERAVTPAARSVAHIAEIAARFGGRAVVWRYDPVIVTSLTPADFHIENFERLAGDIAPFTDEVVVSFAHAYRKTRRNMDAAAAEHGFAWRDPPDTEKRPLLARLAAIAGAQGLRFSICAQPDLLPPGAASARCIDPDRLRDLTGRPVRTARGKPNRPGCACAPSRDIGAYDTCPHGCVYCYAVRSPAAAVQNHHAQTDSQLLGVSV